MSPPAGGQVSDRRAAFAESHSKGLNGIVGRHLIIAQGPKAYSTATVLQTISPLNPGSS